MSRYTSPQRSDFYQGSNPKWFVTRYKSDLGNHATVSGNIGTALDKGYDPAITAIATTISGTEGICSVPTTDYWSAQVDGMVFRVEIENNVAANLTLDLEFYRGVIGDTLGIEEWQFIEERLGVQNGEELVIGETARSVVFVRVASITNHDNDAQAYISARLATSAEIAASGGDIERGAEIVGVKGWYATTRKWLGIAVDATGQIVTSSAAAVLALLTSILAKLTETDTEIDAQGLTLDGILLDTADIETATETSATAVGSHDAATPTVPGIKILVEALDDPAAAAVASGDLVRPRATTQGGIMIAGYDAANTQTEDMPVLTHDSARGTTGIGTVDIASDAAPVDVGDNDAVMPWSTQSGARVVAGYDAANTLSRPLPLVNGDDAAGTVGVPIAGRADTTAPADVGADGDAVLLWMSVKGSPVVAGYDNANTVSKVLPVETTDGATNDTGIPVGGEAFAGTPTAIGEGDFGLFSTTLDRATRTAETRGLNYSTSSVEAWKKAPSGFAQGTSNIAAAATALNSGTSQSCVRVHVQALQANANYIMVGGSTVTLTTGVQLWPGDAVTLEIDDVAKVYGYAATANDDLQWLAETR